MTSSSHEQQDSGQRFGEDSGEIEHPEISGKVVILAILGLAILGTGYAWWHQQQRGRQALEFWGREAAMAVRHAREIDLVRIDQKDGDQVVPLKDARGLIHARQALIVDASYDWQADTSAATPVWEYALRFPAEEPRGEHTLWFDLKQGLAGDESGANVAKIKIAEGLQIFFDEQVQGTKSEKQGEPVTAEEL